MTERGRKNIRYTLSTFAIEGLRPSEEAIQLYERMEDGELSLGEVLREIEGKYRAAGEKRG